MESIKIIVLICILLIYPLLPGSFLCWVTGKKEGRGDLAQFFITGVLFYGALFGMLSFVCVRINLTLDFASKAIFFMTLMLLCCCIIMLAVMKEYRMFFKRNTDMHGKRLGKTQFIILLAFFIVAGVYIVRPFPLDIGFYTPEKVVTMLDTGLLSGTNILLGGEGTPEGNWKQQICNLPLFYACLCKWTSLSPVQVLFDVIPYVVLILAMCVIKAYADKFLGPERDSAAIALLIFSFVTVCGNAAYMNTSYGLLQIPYESMTVFSSVMLPLVYLYMFSKEKLLFLMLVFLDSVFLVGVEKGITMLGLQMICIFAAMLILCLAERRKSIWN